MLQTMPDILVQSRENVKSMWTQLDPRSDWVICTSAPENPMMLLRLKPEVVAGKKLSITDQEHIMQDIVDEVGFPIPFAPGFHRLVVVSITSYLLSVVTNPSCRR